MPELSAADATTLAADIVAWLGQQRDAAGAERFVLGLSGGIDSATVCGLCARAAGPDRVIGVIMPSHSNPDDAMYGAMTAEAFGVTALQVDLSGVTDALQNAITSGTGDLGEAADEQRQRLARANLRPRLRMTTIYAVANLTGGLVVGTGNRSEASIGYFTKYGDGGVDLMPIVDLYKYEVRAVARAIGVPEPIITKPPSAGLWPGQTDEAEIGLSYDTLDTALIALAAGDADMIEPAARARIEGLARGSAHKRAPVPAFRRSV